MTRAPKVTDKVVFRIERDKLFDDYMRTLDQIESWTKNMEKYSTQVSTHKHGNRTKMLRLLRDNLITISERLRQLDAIICPPNLSLPYDPRPLYQR